MATRKELRQWVAHEGWVKSVAFSPDGKTLASGGNEPEVRLWEAATGIPIRQLTGHQRRVNSVAFSPDGKTLASGTLGESRIRFWDADTGKGLRPLEMPESWVTSLAFSPDGKTLASTDRGDTIYVWEVATRQERCRFVDAEVHEVTRGPMCLAFSPDGRVLASGSIDATVLLGDVTGRLRDGRLHPIQFTGEELQRLWGDLEGNDARKAHRAIWQLVAAAEQSVPFIQKHLPPARAADPQQVARLIQDLDSDRFAVRQKAAQELEKLGEAAEPALRQVLRQKGLVLEVRRRVEQLLEQIVEKLPPVPRALEVLEHISTPEARQVLAVLAQGAPEARLTREAKAALGRLARRPAAAP